MFIDQVKIYVRGGRGGNGAVSFRREKFVPRGGPDGGSGGRGGHVILTADGRKHTLLDFRYRQHLTADRGQNGQGKNQNGRQGKDLIVEVPPGTVVKDADTNEVLADLVHVGQSVVVARGGRGGRGNSSFSTARRRAPKFAEKGEPGEERTLILELKVISDVGLVGFPNAGKSTLLARITAARPKIADYPFTTMAPNLGVIQVRGEKSFVIADLPGLIKGAHRGAGLGHRFLRHIERTKVLLYLIDVSAFSGRSPVEDYENLKEELRLYNPALLRRPQLVVGNKIDMPDSEKNLALLQEHVGCSLKVTGISALTGEGIEEMLDSLVALLEDVCEKEQGQVEGEKIPVPAREGKKEEQVTVERQGSVFLVRGKKIERLVAMTDFENEEASKRFQYLSRKMGLEDELKRKGIREGDIVQILHYEFIYKKDNTD